MDNVLNQIKITNNQVFSNKRDINNLMTLWNTMRDRFNKIESSIINAGRTFGRSNITGLSNPLRQNLVGNEFNIYNVGEVGIKLLRIPTFTILKEDEPITNDKIHIRLQDISNTSSILQRESTNVNSAILIENTDDAYITIVSGDSNSSGILFGKGNLGISTETDIKINTQLGKIHFSNIDNSLRFDIQSTEMMRLNQDDNGIPILNVSKINALTTEPLDIGSHLNLSGNNILGVNQIAATTDTASKIKIDSDLDLSNNSIVSVNIITAAPTTGESTEEPKIIMKGHLQFNKHSLNAGISHISGIDAIIVPKTNDQYPFGPGTGILSIDGNINLNGLDIFNLNKISASTDSNAFITMAEQDVTINGNLNISNIFGIAPDTSTDAVITINDDTTFTQDVTINGNLNISNIFGTAQDITINDDTIFTQSVTMNGNLTLSCNNILNVNQITGTPQGGTAPPIPQQASALVWLDAQDSFSNVPVDTEVIEWTNLADSNNNFIGFRTETSGRPTVQYDSQFRKTVKFDKNCLKSITPILSSQDNSQGMEIWMVASNDDPISGLQRRVLIDTGTYPVNGYGIFYEKINSTHYSLGLHVPRTGHLLHQINDESPLRPVGEYIRIRFRIPFGDGDLLFSRRLTNGSGGIRVHSSELPNLNTTIIGGEGTTLGMQSEAGNTESAFIGNIGSLIIYNTLLTDAEADSLDTYLRNRFLNAPINRIITMNDDTRFIRDVTMNGNLNSSNIFGIAPDTSTDAIITMNDDTTFTQDVTIDGITTINGLTTVNNDATFNQGATFNQNVAINGSITCANGRCTIGGNGTTTFIGASIAINTGSGDNNKTFIQDNEASLIGGHNGANLFSSNAGIRVRNMHGLGGVISSYGAVSSDNVLSDDRYKSRTVDCTLDALSCIRQVRVREFEEHVHLRVEEGVEDTDLSGVEHYHKIGVVAQELEQIPGFERLVIEFANGIVNGDKNPTKSVNYGTLNIYLLKAVQQLADQVSETKQLDVIVQSQQTEINNLKTENTLLKSKLNEILTEMGKSTIN